MDLNNSQDIFPKKKMNKLYTDLKYVQMYINDLLAIINSLFYEINVQTYYVLNGLMNNNSEQ